MYTDLLAAVAPPATNASEADRFLTARRYAALANAPQLATTASLSMGQDLVSPAYRMSVFCRP